MRMLVIGLMLLCCGIASIAEAQILSYPAPQLDAVFPSGAQAGTSVTAEFMGGEGLNGATHLLIDGPPGITASEVKLLDAGRWTARLEIAPNAVPGLRRLRLAGGKGGHSNFRYFLVGTLPEVQEQEPNSVEQPQTVSLPTVVNGRIQPTLDVDAFRFAAKAGQKLVATVTAFRLDGILDIQKGYIDTNLELTDAQGRVIATEEDSLGLDPLLHVTIPADGNYTLAVRSLSFLGSLKSVYRLTIGELPYPTSLFPAGGRRGTATEVELAGPNVEPTRRRIDANANPAALWQHVVTNGIGLDLPFVLGDHPEVIEAEPNNSREQASMLAVPSVANGRFATAGDEDWYRLSLKAGEAIRIETQAQRLIASPADTAIELVDATGRVVAENDDGRAFVVQCAHDFESNDSWLVFRAAVAGDYFVRVRDMNDSANERAVYRLTVEPLLPDFHLSQWPDTVPIWGPGTSAGFVVEIMKWGGLNQDIQVSVDGLPPGWTGSVANWPMSWYGVYDGNGGVKLLLTITAPADAPKGAVAPFRVIGTVTQDGRTITREARYYNLYGNGHNDRMHVRLSSGAQAVVVDRLDSMIDSPISELTIEEGGSVNIPVKIARPEGATNAIGLVINGPTAAAGCGLRPPVTIDGSVREYQLPLTVPEWKPGVYGITVARSWTSDLRTGRPGPCTPLIKLTVTPKK